MAFYFIANDVILGNSLTSWCIIQNLLGLCGIQILKKITTVIYLGKRWNSYCFNTNSKVLNQYCWSLLDFGVFVKNIFTVEKFWGRGEKDYHFLNLLMGSYHEKFDISSTNKTSFKYWGDRFDRQLLRALK